MEQRASAETLGERCGLEASAIILGQEATRHRCPGWVPRSKTTPVIYMQQLMLVEKLTWGPVGVD